MAVASTLVIDADQPVGELDVVGIGNALVDVLTHEGDAFIAANGLAKGSMTLVDTDRGGSIELAGPTLALDNSPGLARAASIRSVSVL